MSIKRQMNVTHKTISLSMCVGLLGGCMPSEDNNDTEGSNAISVPITIDTATVRNTVSNKFLSVALDAAQQVPEINFWDDEGTFDYNRPALLNMAKHLSPGYFRVGGTDGDKMFYQVGSQKTTAKPESYGGTFTEVQADAMFNFAQNAGLDVIFGLNGGPATRDQNGAWTSTNSDALRSYLDQKQFEVAAWELANEPGLYPAFHIGEELLPEQLADDHVNFKNSLTNSTTLFIGPDEAYAPIAGGVSLTTDAVNNIDSLYPPAYVATLEPAGAHIRAGSYLKDYLTALPAGTLDALTWHYYPQQSARCFLTLPAVSSDLLLDPEKLNDIKIWISEIESYRDLYQPDAEIWLGETGNAQCGGQVGISDRFASSFWWLDELGVLAQHDNDVAIRQTLAGSEYGLIDNVTLQPRSDYWASVLWKMNMGHKVLNVSQQTDENLRVYAHCDPKEPGNLSLLAINLDSEAHFELDTSVWEGKETLQYVMTAEQLGSTTIKINGEEMSVDDNGEFVMPVKQVVATSNVSIEPRSIAFVNVKGAEAQACM